MSPQRKGLVRPADVERIQRAIELKAWTELELADAIVTAMRNGGSIREVAAASGLSERTIARWRAGQGLPTRDDWLLPAKVRREQLYAAYPGLEAVHELLERMDKERGAGS